MLSLNEQEDIRQFVYRELATLEAKVNHDAGSYRYLCNIAGDPVFCHSPVGPVLRYIAPPIT